MAYIAELIVRGVFLGAVYGLLALPMSLTFVTVGSIDFALGSYAVLAAAVGSTFGGIVGMCICNDRRWPETYRVMGLQGVEIVALGYNTPIANIHHREPEHLRMFHHLLSLQAGAYQNAAWVLAAAKCGAEDGHAMIGGSAIVAPTGEIAALALTEEDELIATTLDLELGEYLRRTVFNFAKHRRIEHYGVITSRTGAKTEV